jgi:hypothetical protein
MDSEKSLPLPLTGKEIQEAVHFKLAECMEHNCHLHEGNAYTSARIEVSVKMVLFDYGREVRNNEAVTVAVDSGIPAESDPVESDGYVTMEPMPPNQFRVDTDQPVPVQTIVDGKPKTRHLKYTPRKSKP